MCHAETVSKAGVVLLEKSRVCLDLLNSDVSNVDILVTLWHCDRLKVKREDFNPLCEIDIFKKTPILFSFLVSFYKMAFVAL